MSIPLEDLKIQIQQVLDTIRPFLQDDGGDISFHSLSEDYHLKIQLHGACHSCNMSHFTMKIGVEDTIKENFPIIQSVTAID